ncbi:MAG: YigZ family protein, partial [Candidatus Eisenbacteria sp.]|nr:YigZ family protein [Candidatus Eisenbacteria bacterium]
GVGDVVAVVTRYFGGTKLGKGGLVRAYSSGVKAAMETLELRELVQTVTLRVTVAYADVSPLKHSLPQFEAEVTGEDYGTDVTLVIVLPEEHAESFTEALAGMTGGKAVVEPV